MEPYSKHYVTLISYSGEELKAFVYIKENTTSGQEVPASDRYMGVIIKGKEYCGQVLDQLLQLYSKDP
jgi:hypothetical protein